MIIAIYSSASCMPKYVYQEWKEKTTERLVSLPRLMTCLSREFLNLQWGLFFQMCTTDREGSMCYPKKSCIVGCAGQLPKKFTPSGSISSCCWCAYNLLQALKSFIQKEKLQRRHCCRLGYERPQMDLTCKLRNWNQRVFHAPLNRSATTACWSSSSPCS